MTPELVTFLTHIADGVGALIALYIFARYVV